MPDVNDRGSVNALRGLICILVVLFHAVGDSPVSGLRVPDDTFWANLVDWLAFARMPLFAFIAGYVYAQRPLIHHIDFVIKKARLLLLPVFTIGTIAVVCHGLMPGTNSAPYELGITYLVPPMQYWFLEALFLLFCVAAMLDLLDAYGTVQRTVFLLGAVCAIQLMFAYRINYFAMGGAIYLAPYFFIGIATARYDLLNPTDASSVLWKAVLAIGGGYTLLGIVDLVPETSRISLLALVLGAAVCVIAIKIDWTNGPLAYIGEHSYAIFLFHIFFTAGVRIGAHELGIYNVNLLVLATTGAGLFGPIVIEHFLQRWYVTDTLLLGARWRPPATKAEHSSPHSVEASHQTEIAADRIPAAHN